jgi:hypothetical protein
MMSLKASTPKTRSCVPAPEKNHDALAQTFSLPRFSAGQTPQNHGALMRA